MNKLISHLSQFVSGPRFSTFENVLENRTRYISVVLEDIYQSQNASAVIRTCDCLGVQDVHIIENKNTFQLNPDVVLGSSKWISLYKYNLERNNTLTAIEDLKNRGYRIVATSPHKNDQSLEELDLKKGKIALLFGTELRGLSSTALEMADEFLRIPMAGFTESFNISVSAGIILHNLTNKLRQSDIPWQLSEPEQDKLMLEWLRKSIKRSDLIEEEFLKQSISHP